MDQLQNAKLSAVAERDVDIDALDEPTRCSISSALAGAMKNRCGYNLLAVLYHANARDRRQAFTIYGDGDDEDDDWDDDDW